jgi:D-alanyl-D-alanine carboxypeptidase
MASVERNGIRLIGVVFGGKSSKRRDLHLMGLLTSAFKKASPPKLILVSTPLSKPKTFIRVVKDLETPIPKPIYLATTNLSKKIINIKNWGIQVGTYSKKVSAHQIAIKARRIAPEILKMLPAQLTPIYINENMAWRVRFNSLDENSARTTCSKLLSKNISCIPVPSEQLLGYLIKK